MTHASQVVTVFGDTFWTAATGSFSTPVARQTWLCGLPSWQSGWEV